MELEIVPWYNTQHPLQVRNESAKPIDTIVPSKLRACALLAGSLLTENRHCAHKKTWPQCIRLVLLTVVQGTAQGVCVFAQTHTKLGGTLIVTQYFVLRSIAISGE